MKLNEMIAKKSGLPDGFTGERAKWNEVKEAFTILKACILQRPATAEDGSPLEYAQGPKAGEPIQDRQLALCIKGDSGNEYIIRTNSKRLVSLYTGDLDREPDLINRYGDSVYNVEPPEGRLKFVSFKYEYKNGMKADIADLQEAD